MLQILHLIVIIAEHPRSQCLRRPVLANDTGLFSSLSSHSVQNVGQNEQESQQTEKIARCLTLACVFFFFAKPVFIIFLFAACGGDAALIVSVGAYFSETRRKSFFSAVLIPPPHVGKVSGARVKQKEIHASFACETLVL